MPPYYRQENKRTCSIAVLRSVLASKGIFVNEKQLVEQVAEYYGARFQNIWNPTIAKLAVQYGVNTRMFGLLPLFKPSVLSDAMSKYQACRDKIENNACEHSCDICRTGESLSLLHTEIFEAIRLGCKVAHGSLSQARLKSLISTGAMIQVSIRNNVLYPNEGKGFHSILIHSIQDDSVLYNDPARATSMSCSIAKIVEATKGTGAFMAFY